jgi:creatinine amidohydrolase
MTINYFPTMLPHELEAAITSAPVAYLPLGTLEYHGPHLPVGNDTLKAEAILQRVCEQAGGVLLPAHYWGIGGGHKTYPYTIIVRDQLLGELLDEILAGLYRTGFRVIVLLTGHYPGEQVEAVKAAASRFLQAHPDSRVWALPEHEAYPAQLRADHAARWETSILQYLRPELVHMERISEAARPGAPTATRSLEEMNASGPLHGILGENPALTASQEQGKETVDEIVENLVAWVQQAIKEII